MTIKGNIGEWSEIYTLLKVLGEEKLYAGNESLEKLEDIVYPVIKVLRTEASGNFEYQINQNIVFISSNGKELLRLPAEEFTRKAQITLKQVLNNKKLKNTTFAIPEIEAFMEQIHCKSLKASSTQKTDITIVIHDEKTNQQPVLGFSIKSQLGSPSTLLNAGKTTNFRYKVNGLTSTQLAEINAIEGRKKIIDRVAKIKILGGILTFDKILNSTFSNNLILIDSLLPQIISEMLLSFYTKDSSTVADLVQLIENSNPIGFDNSNEHRFYTYKVKKMLTDMALGLTPAKVWTGKYDATGGYLVVKDDGEVLCYHLYNRNDFEDYLFANTKLETASTTRYAFGSIYQEGEDLYFNLNLQIRFIK
ncbi:HpaII family restriction endonuclease [Psychrobacter fulvigenes]|uniref:HpaII family restriction endonuclease n=1 Tax=Psychrobacter fulvigenes TaxID=533323 RepID=UPI0019193FBB|nr:HpaII family restriction endonuclease [Psychrobacter fulvigenes]